MHRDMVVGEGHNTYAFHAYNGRTAPRDAGAFGEPTYRDALLRLKRVFDTSNVIAPGRYLPHG
jgi:hypothetical protein